MLSETDIKLLDERERLLLIRENIFSMLRENDSLLEKVNASVIAAGIEGYWYYDSETKSIKMPSVKNKDKEAIIIKTKEFQFTRYPDSMEERAYKTKTPL